MLGREADENFTLGVTRRQRALAWDAHRAGGAGSSSSPAHISGLTLTFLNLDFSSCQRIKWKNLWKVFHTGQAHSMHPDDETTAGAAMTIFITVTAVVFVCFSRF